MGLARWVAGPNEGEIVALRCAGGTQRGEGLAIGGWQPNADKQGERVGIQ